jgi:two-component system, NarL family, sensor kinase
MRARLVVIAGATVASVMVALTALLHVSNVDSSLAVGVTDWWLTGITMGVVYTLTGGWILWRRPDLAIGALLVGIGLSAGVGMFALEYGVRSLEVGGWPGGSFALWLGNWVWAVAMVSVVALVPHLLPEGRVPQGRRRMVAGAGVVATLAMALVWMTTPYDDISVRITARARNPLAIQNDGLAAVLFTGVVLGTVVSVVAVVLRWRRSQGEIRQQLKWVLVGVTGSFVLFAAGFAAGPVVTAAAMIPLPAALVLAVLRLGLWDVDVVISRGLTWLAVLMTLVLVYVAVLSALTLVVPDAGAGQWPGVLAAVVTVALSSPVHAVYRREVNLRVHGVEEDPATDLANLGRRLEGRPLGGQSAEMLLGEAISSLSARLGVEGVRLRLADGGHVGDGSAAESGHVVRLQHADREVGSLELPSALAELGRRRRGQVARLLPGLAVVAHGALLERMLSRATGELADVREEERRELHRELHDGLGPALAAMALKAEVARDLVASDPARAAEILDCMVPQLTDTVSEVRSVVLGLRPSTLDELGLEGALAELVEGFCSPDQRVTLRCAPDALGGLAAATEVATYRIVAEALTNAHRHARASNVEVDVRRSRDEVEVCITDDGAGITAGGSVGIGLASMSGRAADVGGRLEVGPAPGGAGTRVSALLPGATG